MDELLRPPPTRRQVLLALAPAHLVLAYCSIAPWTQLRIVGGRQSGFHVALVFRIDVLLAAAITVFLTHAALRTRHDETFPGLRSAFRCFGWGWLNAIAAAAVLSREPGIIVMAFLLGGFAAVPFSLGFALVVGPTASALHTIPEDDTPARRERMLSVVAFHAMGAATLSTVVAAVSPKPHWPFFGCVIAALFLAGVLVELRARRLSARRRAAVAALAAGEVDGVRMVYTTATPLTVEARRLLPLLSHHDTGHVLLARSTPCGDGAYRAAPVERPIARV